MSVPTRILPSIVLAQFLCTSLWFAGNAVIGDLVAEYGLAPTALTYLVSAVQAGFIIGTFTFALLTITDRYSPSLVFLCCALGGALVNLTMALPGNSVAGLQAARVLTGFFLAGIYPVGMKIAADYFGDGLGRSLGFLVGALVLGTALPHLLNAVGGELAWRYVIVGTSVFAVLGGLTVKLFVGDGPHRRRGTGIDLSAFLTVFRGRAFRAAAFGYFGHMWELYAFWAFVPVLIGAYADTSGVDSGNEALFSFLVIGAGAVSCGLAGVIAERVGARRVAITALVVSVACCVSLPLLFSYAAPVLFGAFLLLWGAAVVADSPMFSTMVAWNAPGEQRGTALTIVNCIGFSITIASIQLIGWLARDLPLQWVLPVLAIGPVFSLLALRNKQARPS